MFSYFLSITYRVRRISKIWEVFRNRDEAAGSDDEGEDVVSQRPWPTFRQARHVVRSAGVLALASILNPMSMSSPDRGEARKTSCPGFSL